MPGSPGFGLYVPPTPLRGSPRTISDEVMSVVNGHVVDTRVVEACVEKSKVSRGRILLIEVKVDRSI